MIAQQSDNNCVWRALSTMRLALGYDIAVPKEFENDIGPKSPIDVLNTAKKWFPDHDVSVFCGQDIANVATDKSTYNGANWDMAEKEVDEHIIAFSYYTTNSEISHFVIGAPTLYDNMYTSMIVCVKQ